EAGSDRAAAAGVEFTGGLVEADDALGAKGDGLVQRAAAMEIHPGLRAAHEAAGTTMTSNSMRPGIISCDVLVVGGGAARLAAAAAAGRAGAHVALLEQQGFLGGAATASQVGTVCGLYLRDCKSAQPALVAGGFVREFE